MQGSQQLPQISTTPSLSNPNNSVRMLLLLLALTLFVQLELMLAFFEQIGFLFVFSFSFPCMICIWKHPWSKPCSSKIHKAYCIVVQVLSSVMIALSGEFEVCPTNLCLTYSFFSNAFHLHQLYNLHSVFFYK